MIYIAYGVTLATIVGTVANSFGKRWCFWVWMCTNGFWCVYNVWIGQYAQGLLYALNFAMAIVGLVRWKGDGKAKQDQQERRYNYSVSIKKASIAKRILLSWVMVASIFFLAGLIIGVIVQKTIVI